MLAEIHHWNQSTTAMIEPNAWGEESRNRYVKTSGNLRLWITICLLSRSQEIILWVDLSSLVSLVGREQNCKAFCSMQFLPCPFSLNQLPVIAALLSLGSFYRLSVSPQTWTFSTENVLVTTDQEFPFCGDQKSPHGWRTDEGLSHISDTRVPGLAVWMFFSFTSCVSVVLPISGLKGHRVILGRNGLKMGSFQLSFPSLSAGTKA